MYIQISETQTTPYISMKALERMPVRSIRKPNRIGTISGIVGLAGGLGGFILPIMFGLLMDLTGIRSSAFMLLYGVVWVSLIWMYWTEVRKTEMMGRNAPASPLSRSFAR